jgi:hypothetical protein
MELTTPEWLAVTVEETAIAKSTVPAISVVFATTMPLSTLPLSALNLKEHASLQPDLGPGFSCPN